MNSRSSFLLQALSSSQFRPTMFRPKSSQFRPAMFSPPADGFKPSRRRVWSHLQRVQPTVSQFRPTSSQFRPTMFSPPADGFKNKMDLSTQFEIPVREVTKRFRLEVNSRPSPPAGSRIQRFRVRDLLLGCVPVITVPGLRRRRRTPWLIRMMN